MNNILIGQLFASLGISVLVCFIIITRFTQRKTIAQKRSDTNAIQASHTLPTPRVGGIALVLALITIGLTKQTGTDWDRYCLLLVSALPVFIVGLAEDLGIFASPRRRLLAAGISGALFITITGEWLSRAGVPGLDGILEWTSVAILLSIFLATGISHAFNLIDGLNGLSGFTGLAASLALAIIAHQAGLSDHKNTLLIIGAAICGFLVFNYPSGKIFLGDAGAYLIGHLLFWMSVSILWNAPFVSPFAMLLIFFWPVADTLLAIARRLVMGKPIAQPDRLHFHQLVMRTVEIVLLGRKKRRIANPLATLLTLPLIFAPMITGVLLATDYSRAPAACAIFGVIFFTTYKAGMWLAPKLRRSTFPKKYQMQNKIRNFRT